MKSGIAPRPVRISNSYTVDDWNGLTFTDESDWTKAVLIFEDRIRSRFLNPIERIVPPAGNGFAVMALDCLLIETLQQFRHGVSETPRNDSKRYFREFLATTSFKEYFDQDTADTFYTTIRCGLLHQAETRGGSRLVLNSPSVVTAAGTSGIVLDRGLFHDRLLAVFDGYLAELRDPSNHESRTNFKRKMDYICQNSLAV